MDEEFLNPRRQYKHFRPRQASRGSKTMTAPTFHAAVSLFNNSTGAHVLVVRDVLVTGTANDLVYMSNQPGQIGTSQGAVQQYLNSSQQLAGLVAGIDTSTGYPPDYIIALSSTGAFEWFHDFPFDVLEPGFSLLFWAATVAHAMTVSVIWEAIEIDQLDYFS